MFRTKLSKFKQVIAVAIIPRIFVRDTKPIKNKLHNYTHDVFNFARKSTDSGSKDDEIEKQRQIIEKCFGETPQPSESKDLKHDSSEMEKEHRNIESSDFVRLSDAEKCDVANAPDNEPSHATSGIQAEEASVQATTANIAEETLDQRVETIDETPHVEASPQKIEGFNSTPKVLGHDIEFFAEEKIQKIDLDDLAKRCVGAPIGDIDEMLIKEMKNMANNDIKTQTDMNLIKCHGVEKYYSGIFEHFSKQTTRTQKVDDTPKEPLCLFEENTSVGDKEIKSERITPLHLDAVHLFAFDEGSKDYKENVCFRDSFVYLSSDIEEPLLDVPNTITPYESPAMPFHEYDSKDKNIPDNLGESNTMQFTGIATDPTIVADIPRAEEVFSRKADINESRLVTEKQEINPVESETTLSHSARPILVDSKLKEHDISNGFGNLSREQLLKLLNFYKNSTVNKIKNSHVFSTSIETPPAAINPSPNSSISGTFVPEVVAREGTQETEMPASTAISANQNPGEYYNMVFLDEHQDSNLIQQQQTLTADNHIMQAFCTQLQEIQDGVSKETEDSIMVLEYPVLLRDPFSYIAFKPEMKRNTINIAPDHKVIAAAIENVTGSLKNDVTSTDEGVPLSQVLKRIRDKNRLEFCRNLLLQSAKPETSKNFTCMAPLDSNKQKNSPRPCQPPPKPPKEKCPKPCPPPCPPKKDPCAKLIPFFLNTIIRFDDPFDIQDPMKQHNGNYCYKTMLTDDIIERLRKLGETLRFVKVDRDINYMKDATCARDFEPWTPIPSWPAPKVEKRRPFVCPKEGCKPVPIPRSNPPKQKPCLGYPKKFFSQPFNTPDIIFIHLYK